MSTGQLWMRRPELHFLYNLAVFVPMIVTVWMHWNGAGLGDKARVESHADASEEELLAAA